MSEHGRLVEGWFTRHVFRISGRFIEPHSDSGLGDRIEGVRVVRTHVLYGQRGLADLCQILARPHEIVTIY